MQFIGVWPLKLSNTASSIRILIANQLVAAYVDAVQRGRCFLKIVATIKRLGQHNLCIGVTWLQCYCLLQPFLRVIEPVGKQCNPTS